MVISVENELIMGIDPGSLRTGFGIIKKTAQGITHVAHGTIVLDAKKEVSQRIGDLARDLVCVIAKYRPHKAVVEDVFFYKNARSALVLGQARGAVLSILGLHDISVESFSPTAVKALVTGLGKAKKFQVAQLVALELNISVPSSLDSSDALALALACAHHKAK